MSDDETAAARPRPGGRSARVVTAVHTATLELLGEVGYDGLQLPDVAARANVNKTTVYRRWPTKAALVADLLSHFTRSAVATPDTGSLRGDLEELLGEIAEALANRTIRAVLYGALAADDANHDFLEARRRFWAERFTRSGEVVARAHARGEIDDELDPRTFLEIASGPIYFRALFSDEAVDATFIDEVVRRTLRGHGID